MSVRSEFLQIYSKKSLDATCKTAVQYLSDVPGKGLTLSYSTLNRITDELSFFLSQHFGRSEGEYVGVCLSDKLWLPCIILLAWKRGMAIAGYDTNLPSEKKSKFFNTLQIKYIITDSESHSHGNFSTKFYLGNQIFFVWINDFEKEKTRKPPPFWEMCYAVLTSGTTGESKIIQVPWTCIMPNVTSLVRLFRLSDEDNILLSSPYTFDLFYVELLLSLMTGASLTITPNHLTLLQQHVKSALFDPRTESKIICDKIPASKDSFFICDESYVANVIKVTVLQMTPSLFRKLIQNNNYLFSSESTLRTLILGGENFPLDVIKEQKNQSLTIFNIYGITEISCWAFIKEVITTTNVTKVSLGSPLNDVVYKLNKHGEFSIGSANRKCLINDEPYLPECDVIYRETGDIIESVNDELFYMGRSNRIIKKYGIKVDLQRIETAYLKMTELVTESYCVFHDTSQKLGIYLSLVGHQTSSSDFVLLTSENNQHLMEQLEKVSITLAAVERPDYFVEVSCFPLNDHGKIDMQRLQIHLQSLTSLKAQKRNSDPRIVFSHIWSSVLNIGKPAKPSCQFLDSGGSSISALQILTRLEENYIEVPENLVATMLKNGSVEECLKCFRMENYFCKKLKTDYQIESSKNLAFQESWRFDLGKCVDASPAAYYQNGYNVVVGSHSSRLCSLKGTTGEINWCIELGDRIECKVRIDRRQLSGYVGCYDHFLYCINLSNGVVLWKYKTEDIIKSTPCLSNDEAFVYVASYDRHLHCLKTEDGVIIWKLELSPSGVYSPPVSCPITDALYVGTLDGTCVCVDQKSNQISWQQRLKSPVFSSPCLISKNSSRRILFAEVAGYVHCLSTETGNEIWCYHVGGGNIYSGISYSKKGMIIFGCHDNHVYCLLDELEKPRLKWKKQLDSAVFSTPFAFQLESNSEEVVAAATSKGFVYLLATDSGSIISKTKLGGDVFSSPIFNDNHLVVGCRDNYLYSLTVYSEKK